MAAPAEVTARAPSAGPTPSSAPLRIARAQSWEDPALLAALDVGPGDAALVAEPSGDDALAIAAAGAASVTVAAPDPAARALVELKRAAARELPIQSVRSLLGLGHFGRRVWFYHYLRPGLPAEVQATLDAGEASIREGLAGAGALEREMERFRARVLSLALGRGAVDVLAAAEPAEARRRVLSERFGVRWKAALQLWMPRLARLADAPAEGAAARLGEVLTRVSLADGFGASWLLTGAWRDPERAHPWLSTAGLAALKPRVGVVRVDTGTRRALLEPGAFDVVVLGRRPLDADEAARLAGALRPGGRVLGWCAGPPSAPPGLVLDRAACERLAAADRGIFPGTPWVARRR